MSSAVAAEEADALPQGGADLRIIRRLFGYAKHEHKLLLLALVLYPLDAVAIVAPPYLVHRILDVAIPTRDGHLLAVMGGLYVLALAAEYLTSFGAQVAMGVLGQRAMRKIRADLFAHVIRLPAGFYDRNPIGRLLTRLTSDVEALNDVFATGAVTVISDIITIVAVVGSMLWLDARMTAFSFLVVPPLVLVAVLFQRYARKAFREIRRSIARINTFLAEHLHGMTVVQIFRQEQRTRREFGDLNDEYRLRNRDAVRADAGLFAVVEAIGTCAVAALLWYGASDLSAGAVTAGVLVAFMQYIRRFFVPIRDLSTKYTVLQSAFAGAERIFHLFDTPVTITSPQKPQAAARLERELALDDVWFAYRDKHWVLRGLNLRIARGEHVALVGATGSGKTTVLKLLSRFYDTGRGAVRVDGEDVRSLDLQALRRLYAVVLQDVYLFSGTILDNLTVSGRVDAEQVKRAARAVHADELIQSLPQGYDTPVVEGGANFSVGERQLLAFARALALDPDVLILDEATSNVDSETESRIQTGLDVLMRGRTAIIVAHRLSTIQKASRIVVLREGAVAEEGTHDALLAQGGIYKRLVDLHFQI